MALEIERRFLLKNDSWKEFITKKIYIEQGYLLEIAEIELSSEKEDLFLPSLISKEITGLTHYSNFSLAYNPLSEWKEDYFSMYKSN